MASWGSQDSSVREVLHMSLEAGVTGCGEGSIWEGGSPRGQVWGSKGCGFHVIGESPRMGCGKITRPSSIQSAGRNHAQVWAEVIEGWGCWGSKGRGGWQKETSSRGFTKA